MTFEFSEQPFRRTELVDDGIPALDGTAAVSALPDILCLSHLRWDFVFQRPQHLLTRFGKRRRVFYVEEPVRTDGGEPYNQIAAREEGVMLIVPHIPARFGEEETQRAQRDLLDAAMARWSIRSFVAWYYTPMALLYSSHLKPVATVFDCMDELSAFAGAPPVMVEMEQKLLSRADMVFTGGISLYEAKKHRHRSVYPFPSSIDKDHFLQARNDYAEPPDHKGIPGPRIGYHGVIDERLDLDLLAQVADLRPAWHWVLIGPVCKIDPATLPKRANIHYLGKKDYAELPRYLGKWQVAMMPFAHNASTRFISPTKTPEYLAAGRAVVSTSIKDVQDPYGRAGLVLIADKAGEFVAQCEKAMAMSRDMRWQANVSHFLSQMSWDKTWASMNELVASACMLKTAKGRTLHV